VGIIKLQYFRVWMMIFWYLSVRSFGSLWKLLLSRKSFTLLV